MNRPNTDRILMPHDCLRHALSLRRRSTLSLEDVQGHDTTVDVKGHEHVAGVLVDSPNVVEQTGEKPGFVAEFPGGEVLSGDSEACANKVLNRVKHKYES